MTMGPTQAFHLIAEKYGGVDTTDDRAIDHFLQVVLPTLLPRRQQMIVDEVFFLTTGLPPMYADVAPTTHVKGAATRQGKTSRSTLNLHAVQDAFELQRRVTDVFRTEPTARAWLTRPNRVLKNKTPLSVLGTKAGNARVEQILGQIEHGGHSEPAHDCHGGREDHEDPRHGGPSR